MAVEIGVVCPEVPDAEQVARLAGLLMSMVLHRPVIHARSTTNTGAGWCCGTPPPLSWTGARPARHEFADGWFLNVDVNERGIDLSLLLTFMTAASIAIIGDGRIIDDAKLIGGGELSGGDLLTRAAGAGLERSPRDVLAALGSYYWGE